MAPPLDLNNTFGAFLIGVIVSSALFGVTCTQMFYYFQNYPADSVLFKIVVAVLFVLEAVHSVLAIHATYYYVILNYANPRALATATWSAILTIEISAIIMLIVHLFYARRVYYMSRKNIPLTILVVALALVHYATSTAVAVQAFKLKFFKAFFGIDRLVDSGLALAAVADTIIAGSLSYFLHTSRSGIKSTDTMINKLMVYTINNGIVTSVFDILVVAFVAREPQNLIFLSIFQVVGNLYTNSMMATLNSRRYISQSAHQVVSGGTQPMTTFKIASQTAVGTTQGTAAEGSESGSTHEAKHYPIQITTTRDVDVV